jgi:hypothetical protein
MALDEYIYRVTFEYTDRFKRKCRGLTVVTDSSWEQAVEQTREKFLVDTFDQIGGRVISESEAEQQPVYWELVKK